MLECCRQTCISFVMFTPCTIAWLVKPESLAGGYDSTIMETQADLDIVPEQVLAANIVAVAWNTYLSNASHSAVASQPEDLV